MTTTENMLTACFTSSDVSSDGAYQKKQPEQSHTTWYIGLPDESVQLLKEERTDRAIYNVYVKKISYHSADSDNVETSNSSAPVNCANSTFYTDLKDETKSEKCSARLQWSLQEVRVLRYGTVECLVDSLMSESGDLDSSFVNTFLATYRTFTSTANAINTLLCRYKTYIEDSSLHQLKKEGRKRSTRTVLMMWLDLYGDDFRCDSPSYETLRRVETFARSYLPHSDIASRCHSKLTTFQALDEKDTTVSVDDISLEFSVLSVASTVLPSGECRRNTSTIDYHYVVDAVSSRKFAEQLTAVDAELFRNVVPHQCLGSVWSRRHDDRKRAAQVASVYATVRQFNAVSYRVIATVVRQRHLTFIERAAVIERWINIAQELRRLKNFSSLKAIISGLQSSAVYRLRRTWSFVNRSKFTLFQELARIFCDDDNQRICREVLYREGTAKYADPNTVNNVCAGTSGNGTLMQRQTSCLPVVWSTSSRRNTVAVDSSLNLTLQGTVPYLGTFLTDLMMIDSALKDAHDEDDRLINFDKRRKEFEVLTQIRLLQSAATLYRIRKDAEFLDSFTGITIYDDNESYMLSCEIEPELATPAGLTARRTPRRNRRDSSLSYFTVRRPSVSSSPAACSGVMSGGCWPSAATDSLDNHSLRSLQDSMMSSHGRAQSLPRPSIRQCSSVCSMTSPRPDSGVGAVQQSTETVVARVYLRIADSDLTSQYKSILLSNCDHTSTVLSNALLKYNKENEKASDYKLCQLLQDGTELCLPDDVNVFYAVNVHTSSPVEFIVRPKLDSRRRQSRPTSRLLNS